MTVNSIITYDRVIKDIIDNSKLDGLVKFKFLQIAKQFEPIVSDFQKVRDELISKIGSQLDNGSVGILEPKKDDYDTDAAYQDAVKTYTEQVEEFQKQLTPILNEEVSVDIKKIKADVIMNSGISSEALLVIFDLIEE